MRASSLLSPLGLISVMRTLPLPVFEMLTPLRKKVIPEVNYKLYYNSKSHPSRFIRYTRINSQPDIETTKGEKS